MISTKKVQSKLRRKTFYSTIKKTRLKSLTKGNVSKDVAPRGYYSLLIGCVDTANLLGNMAISAKIANTHVPYLSTFISNICAKSLLRVCRHLMVYSGFVRLNSESDHGG